jgi:hypothetical protein
MGTKNDPGKYDCYAAAEDDEPMFVLLARDSIAPILIQLWADIRDMSKPEDIDKIAEAIGCAHDMETWRIENRGGGTK